MITSIYSTVPNTFVHDDEYDYSLTHHFTCECCGREWYAATSECDDYDCDDDEYDEYDDADVRNDCDEYDIRFVSMRINPYRDIRTGLLMFDMGMISHAQFVEGMRLRHECLLVESAFG